MERHDARDRRAAAGELDGGGAPEAVAHDDDPRGVHALGGDERVERGPDAGAQQCAVGLVLPRELPGLRGVCGPNALAVDVRGEGGIAHRGELLDLILHEGADAHPVVDHQHAGDLAPRLGVPREQPFAGDVAGLVLDGRRGDRRARGGGWRGPDEGAGGHQEQGGGREPADRRQPKRHGNFLRGRGQA